MPDPIIKEEAQEEEEASETNALEMSDEDFMNQPIPEEKEEAVIEEEESDEQEGAAGGEEPEQNAEESSEDADESEEEGKVEEDNKADGETNTKNIGMDSNILIDYGCKTLYCISHNINKYEDKNTFP